MYQRFSIDAPEIVYSTSHVAMTCLFTDNGTPIDVDSPSFKIYSGTTTGGTDITSQITILRPMQKDPSNVAGKYLVTFLSGQLGEGDYLAVMTGTTDNSQIVATGQLSFHTVSRIQWLIETLLSSLKGKYNLMVPDNLVVIDPRSRSWSDGECYTFLRRALDDVNMMPPLLATPFEFDKANWPEELVNFLIMGGQLYAMFASASLEAQNYFDIQVPIKVNLYRGDKFRDLMTFIKDMYQKNLEMWKQNYWFNYDAEELALVMNRVPIRITRPISDELYMHKLGW